MRIKFSEMNAEIKNYIEKFPDDVQEILFKMRDIVFEEVPEATEKLGYGMPGFYLHKKPLVYFAAYKNHIGFYATPNGHEHFKEELSKFKQGKGSVQFSLKEEIPYDLIRKIVIFRKEKLESEI